MSQVQTRLDEALIRRRPKAPDGLDRFQRSAGSIDLKGPPPSKYFLEERADDWLADRAGN